MVRRFRDAGWELDRVRGSHHIMTKDEKTASIPVHANRDLARGTERALLKLLEEEE